MGISGLLPFLEKASRKTNVSEFRGCTVAIDAYCWLHKGAIGCAEKLARGEDTNSYILYCMQYIRMLRSYDIKPILVFDGQHLPAKRLTEEKRREARRACKTKATELLRMGQLGEARKYLCQSIDVDHKMALALIQECRRNGIDCIVAPYEADAQLAYLNMNKIVHFVISEDSDLLVFGCNKILYKMNSDGFGTLVEADKINNCMKLRNDSYTFDKFRYMCILSGCDYLESLSGVGLKKALKFISITANPSIYNALQKLPSYLKLTNAIVTDEYRNSFMAAVATFKHQLVFDPIKRILVPLTPMTSETEPEHCKIAGDMCDNVLAFQLALGNIHPLSHAKVDDWSPDKCSLPVHSIWSKTYLKPKEPCKKKLSIPSTKNLVVTAQITEQQQIEYDLKLKKELDQYKVVHISKKPKIEEVEKELSPVLNKPIDVPFRNLKKLSKFQRTVINYDHVVTSRFFKSKESKNNSPGSLLSSIDYNAKESLPSKSIESQANKNHTDNSKENDKDSQRNNSKTYNCISSDDEHVEIPIKDATNTNNLKVKFEFKRTKVLSLDQEQKLPIKEASPKTKQENSSDAENEDIPSLEAIIIEDNDDSKVVELDSKSTQKTASDSKSKITSRNEIFLKKSQKNQPSILTFFCVAEKK